MGYLLRFLPRFMLRFHWAILLRSPVAVLAIFFNCEIDIFWLTPTRLLRPLRPGFLPSAIFSVTNSDALI